ncbi:hypothetical protein [Iningainema tapete]|uniref:Response regulatory domain-containing protein n=1 Tax=Iningainema tapete BLCC-T55 TaxID=2748662 RepID=A0A8J6XHC2_9CYAN|nr:hypothetical protein [Iningainema tapete]MBD2770586.1 hypothetical protein [Iningainema tapete BLCC-T55]
MEATFEILTMNQDFLNPPKILVVDDHELMLYGTLDVLSKQYPETGIITVQTAEDAFAQVQISLPSLAVIDLSIPEKAGMTAQIDTGIQLLQRLMSNNPFLNLMVQSSYVKALVRIRHDINNHQGGFAVADQGLSKKEMLTRLNLAHLGLLNLSMDRQSF